jgi:hypothetical protein
MFKYLLKKKFTFWRITPSIKEKIKNMHRIIPIFILFILVQCTMRKNLLIQNPVEVQKERSLILFRLYYQGKTKPLFREEYDSIGYVAEVRLKELREDGTSLDVPSEDYIYFRAGSLYTNIYSNHLFLR